MHNSTLATWDTTSITDGDYILRLRVFFQDGSSQDVIVSVTVRNEAVPTATPLPPTPTAENVAVLIPTPFLLQPRRLHHRGAASHPHRPSRNPACPRPRRNLLQPERGALIILVCSFSLASSSASAVPDTWNLTHDT